MKALKWLVVIVLIVPVLVFAALAAFLSFADLNKYKDTLETQAEAATGRKVSIDGDLHVSLFPWVKLETGAIQVANAEGFSDEPMLSLDAASASVKLLPLISGSIELGVVSVKGLNADLQVNTKGVSNLDDLLGETDGQTSAPATVEQNAEESEPSEIPEFSLSGLELQDATLRYRDASTGTETLATNVNLDIGQLKNGSKTPVSGSLSLLTKPDNMNADVTLDGTIQANLKDMLFSALSLDLSASLSGESIPTDSLNVGVGGDLHADMNAQTLDIPALKFKLGEDKLNGSATLTNLDQPMPSVRFNLSGDTLNVDQLLGLDTTSTEPTTPDGDASGSNTAQTTTASPANSGDAIELPIEMLRQLDVDGQLTLENLIVSNMLLTDITLPLQAANGVLSIPALKASLYDGKIETQLSLDTNKSKPSYKAKASITGVQAQPLLKAAADTDTVLGSGDIQLAINTAGNSISALTSGLNGDLNFNFTDGAIDGVNIAAEARKVLKLLGKSVGDTADANNKQTDFSAMGASATITNGVLKSNDLDLRSPLIRVGGNGTVDLSAEQVNYTVDLLLTESLEGQGGQTMAEADGVRISSIIKGSFTDLSADFAGALSRGIEDAVKADLKAQADEKIAEEKAKLKAKLDAEKAKAKAEFEAKRAEKEAELKAKAKAEADKLKNELKEKAGNALKNLF